MRKDYSQIRKNAAMHAKHARFGVIGTTIALGITAMFSGMTKLSLDSDLEEIGREGRAASTEALATFDNILLPRLSSDDPLPISRISSPASTPETYLNNCVIEQSNDNIKSAESETARLYNQASARNWTFLL